MDRTMRGSSYKGGANEVMKNQSHSTAGVLGYQTHPRSKQQKPWEGFYGIRQLQNTY
jgi:hypothetical protein